MCECHTQDRDDVKVYDCMVGGGINVFGVPDLVNKIRRVHPADRLEHINVPHAQVFQVAHGCVLYRLLQVGVGASHMSTSDKCNYPS